MGASDTPAEAWRQFCLELQPRHTYDGRPIDTPTGYSLIHPIFEALIRTDENEKLFPWLAESWTVAPDGKSITFNLRKGIKFHDGTDFNAEAVKFNLQQVLQANLAGSMC